MGSSTTRSFTVGQLLALTLILQGITIVTTGGSEKWTEKELATFAEEVLSSINALRAKLTTEPVLQLDADQSPKGLNGMALMYAKLMWAKGKISLSVPLQSSIAQVFWEEFLKSPPEMEGLLKNGILYYDSDPRHISGSTLVKLVDKTEKKEMSTGTRDFALEGDHLTGNPTNCNTLIKLLWTRTKKVGVSAFWNAKERKQTYVILFEHVQNTPGKLSSEAVRFLASLKCPKGPVKAMWFDAAVSSKGPVKDVLDTAAVDAIGKAINEFRSEAKLNLLPLKWTAESIIMDLSNVYAFKWAENDEPPSIDRDFKKFPHIFFTDADVYNEERSRVEKLKIARQSQDLAPAVERVAQGTNAHLASKLLKKLIQADVKKPIMPVADSQAVAQTSTLPRISQLLCKDATEFGYFATSYEFKTTIDVVANPIGFNFFVLVFDKKCDTLPDLSAGVKKALRQKWNIEF